MRRSDFGFFAAFFSRKMQSFTRGRFPRPFPFRDFGRCRSGSVRFNSLRAFCGSVLCEFPAVRVSPFKIKRFAVGGGRNRPH